VARILSRLAARALVLSAGVDRAYRWFDRLRSELVAGLASDDVLDRFNEFAYGGEARYRPDSRAFRESLFPFEESVLAQFFPPPPAHILLGGAGGGREAFALAERGYRVTAFEPGQELFEQLARSRGELPIEAHRGAYEDLARLFPQQAADGFDAAIFGWASFSHVRSHKARLDALREFARLTAGPVLVSFLALKSQPTERLARFRRWTPRRADRDPQDVFAMTVGLYHPVDEEEVRSLAKSAGLRVLDLNFDTRETGWPYVVLQRAD
jgi:hypothetical protein